MGRGYRTREQDPEGACHSPALVLQNRFVYNGTLKDSRSYQNARFGSSITSVRDLNQDSYNDVVVGAPLEDNHRGVIYIFHGLQGNILKTPKQVTIYQPVSGAGPRRPGHSRLLTQSRILSQVLGQERILICASSTCPQP